jgi:hypothetical protein
MRTLHRYMLVAALMSSALSFRLASACLSWAQYHKRRYNLLEDERITKIIGLKSAPVAHRSIVSKNKWTDAMPDKCPLCGDHGYCVECVPYRGR